MLTGVSEKIAEGQLPSDGLVWRSGMTEWKPANSVPELAAEIAARKRE